MNKIVLSLIIIFACKAEAQTSALHGADSLFVNGNYSKSIEMYKSVDDQSEVYQKIAKAYMAIGNYDEALLYFEKQIKETPNDALTKFEYAKLLSRVKKYDNATSVFHQLIEIDSQNPNYFYELGLILDHQRDTLALQKFKKAFDIDTTHQKAIFKIAKRHLIKRRFDKVKKYVDIGLNSYANNRELISLMAQNYYWHEDYENGVIWFGKLIDLGERSQFIHEKLSFCYKRTYDFKNAILHQEKAIKYNPKNATNLYILARLYEDSQDYANAEKYYLASILLQDVPMDFEYIRLATVFNHQKKYEESINSLQKAIEENPKNEYAHFILVYTKDKYYEDIDTRLKLYENFKKNHPKSPFGSVIDKRISELKEEKFLKED